MVDHEDDLARLFGGLRLFEQICDALGLGVLPRPRRDTGGVVFAVDFGVFVIGMDSVDVLFTLDGIFVHKTVLICRNDSDPLPPGRGVGLSVDSEIVTAGRFAPGDSDCRARAVIDGVL